MEFKWNDQKRISNIAKHGIDFIDVFPAFSDPGLRIDSDNRHEYGEERYNMLAKLNGRILHITFTFRSECVWLISARKANDRERRRYGIG